MIVDGKSYRAVWMEGPVLFMIDQKILPFRFEIITTSNYTETCERIKDMTVRGAGTIGATAGFAMAQAFVDAAHRYVENPGQAAKLIFQAKKNIESTRPTARDLFYAVERVYHQGISVLNSTNLDFAAKSSVAEARLIADQYAENARMIGVTGKSMIRDGWNILTHCNAGWLALVDHGSALSPLFQAFIEGKKIHVWVDETRPRSQGARLTAWELTQAGIPHTIIADNAAGLLMSSGKVNLVITGADRIALNGDTANKIGTLEKAILAKEYNIPFYVAAPWSTFDRNCPDGHAILIEERDESEVLMIKGPDKNDCLHKILIANPGSHAFNPAFDVTPSKYITGFITETGIITPHDLNNILVTNN